MTPDREAEEPVDLPHPLRVAAGEVVVHRDDVDALAREGVQVDGERWRRGSCLRRSSSRRSCPVEDHAADQLDVEVAHPEDARAPRGRRRRPRAGGRRALPLREALTELGRPPPELVVGERLQEGSSELIRSTIGRIALTSRSCFVPKILVRIALIKKEFSRVGASRAPGRGWEGGVYPPPPARRNRTASATAPIRRRSGCTGAGSCCGRRPSPRSAGEGRWNGRSCRRGRSAAPARPAPPPPPRFPAGGRRGW